MKLSGIGALVRQLEILRLNEFLDVRTLPRVVADEFGIFEEKSISISGKTRSYYSTKHKWLADNHEEVVMTVMNPRQIVTDKAVANRILFYRLCAGGHGSAGGG